MRAKFAAKYPRAAKIRLFIVEKHFDPKAKFRDVAWYQPDVHAVYFLKRALRLSRNTLLGLSAHEIGHGCRSDDCEQCADDTAEGTLGRKIRYDRKTLLQTMGPGVYPRPLTLHRGRTART